MPDVDGTPGRGPILPEKAAAARDDALGVVLHEKEHAAFLIVRDVGRALTDELFNGAGLLEGLGRVLLRREGLIEELNPVRVSLNHVVVPLGSAHGQGGQARGLEALDEAFVARVDEHHVGLEGHEGLEVDLGTPHDAHVDVFDLGVKLTQEALLRCGHARRVHGHKPVAAAEVDAGDRGIGEDVGHGHAHDGVGHVDDAVEMVGDGAGKARSAGQGQTEQAAGGGKLTQERMGHNRAGRRSAKPAADEIKWRKVVSSEIVREAGAPLTPRGQGDGEPEKTRPAADARQRVLAATSREDVTCSRHP